MDDTKFSTPLARIGWKVDRFLVAETTRTRRIDAGKNFSRVLILNNPTSNHRFTAAPGAVPTSSIKEACDV
jgi:hypothetical protein